MVDDGDCILGGSEQACKVKKGELYNHIELHNNLCTWLIWI